MPDGELVVGGDDDDLSRLDIVGSTDAETLQIIESVTGLLPGEAGGLEGGALGRHTNAPFQASGRAPANIPLHFDGGGGSNALRRDFTPSQDVAYFSDDFDTANSGVVNVAGAFTLSFE